MTKPRGFAAMDPALQRELASPGVGPVGTQEAQNA